jgi:hypothetical protein
MKAFLLIIFTSLSVFITAQNTTYIGQKSFTRDQLQSDFDILTKTIIEEHPSVYKFISADSLNLKIDFFSKKLTDGLTDNEFHIIVREFLMFIRCGHTVAMPSVDWYSYYRTNARMLPFEVFILDNKVFIEEYFGTDSVLNRGTEIIMIEGVAVSEILAKMASIQPRDGFSTSFVDASIEKLFRTYYLFLFENKASYQISYKDTNKEIETKSFDGTLSKSEKNNSAYDSLTYKSILKTQSSQLYFPLSNESMAILDINQFQQKDYKKYYKSVFEELKQNEISNLVIDIRGNGGGYFPNANLLLKYLSPGIIDFSFYKSKAKYKNEHLEMESYSKLTQRLFNLKPDRNKDKNTRYYDFHYKPIKKNHFNGKIFLLTDGGSFSMSGFVSAFLKHKTDAILIGSETGGGECGSNGILMQTLTLPATKIRVSIPVYHVDHKINDASFARGVIPDIKVDYTLDEIINKIDKEIEEVNNILKVK